MPGISHLYRRGARYYFRMVVPEALRRIVGKRELVESLNTSNFAEAKRLLPERVYRAHIVLDTAKLRTLGGIGSGEKNSNRPAPWHTVIFPSPLPTNLPDWAEIPPRRELPSERPRLLVLASEDHAQEIARQHFVELERGAAKQWSESLGTLTESELQEIKASLHDARKGIESNSDNGDFHPSHYYDATRTVWRYLERHNLIVKPDGPELATLARLFREAELEHIRRQEDRVCGRPLQAYSPRFDDLSARSILKSDEERMTLTTLCKRFVSEREKAHKAPKTQFQTQVAANLLLEFFGADTPAHTIKRSDAERFCAVLETIPKHRRQRYPSLTIAEAIDAARKSGDAQGLDYTTRRNRFFSAFQIFGYGVAIRELRENPFDDELLKRRCTPPPEHAEQTKEERPPFTIDELNRIFCAPPFTSDLPPKDRTARFWVPLICLFHGMRQSEICQLRTEDVVNWSGGLFFDLCWAEGRRLKNSASRRSVPIHPQILKMGFASYLEARRADTENIDLFPELAPSSCQGSYGTKMSRWFASFLLKLPGAPFRATFHSFRNNFTVAAQKAGVGEDRINRICGWSSGHRQQRGYARDRFLSEHAPEIAKVQFPGLNLPKITL